MSFKLRTALILLLLMTASCSSIVRNALPEDQHLTATVLDGKTNYRFWGDGVAISEHPLEALTEENPGRYAGIMNQPHNYLILSGGGANGAYGAGLLKAWSEMGTRPEFTLVTGISTGALTAPFAFLGSDYDDELEEVYTTLSTESLITNNSIFRILGGDAVVDTTPLSQTLARVVDETVINRLAEEYRNGRTLLIGTTNLDASRPVIWNVTRMAASGHPNAPKLIRQVLLASASIPGAFPPVYIPVTAADGNTYDEMHVDGGTVSQMFFYPSSVDWHQLEEYLKVQGTPKMYVIRNSWVDAEYEVVEPRLIPIAGRTIGSLIRTQGKGDFYRMWSLAERDGIEMSVTWIPSSARTELGVAPTEAFDPKYMKTLFEYAYRRTLDNKVWLSPPHIESSATKWETGQ